MTLICGSRVSLALKHMAEMTSAVGTDNLRSLHAKCAVHMSGHSTGDRIKVCRPTAARLELVVGGIKRGIAAGAVVNTFGRVMVIVFTSAGAFSSLLAEDSELFYCSKLVYTRI